MIERFTLAQFEAALPVHKTLKEPLWQGPVFIKGEYCYTIPVNERCAVTVRSSIGREGIAADTGDDSIRVLLIDISTGKPLAKKLSKWVTRVPGWANRLTAQIRTLYKIGLKLTSCPQCGKARRYNVVKKEGPNQGRAFLVCESNHFQFLEEK